MAVFRCKMCGGDLEITDGMSVCECAYCGTKQTLPKLDDDKKANLYDRANHFRRNNEYDKAMSIYYNILNEDTSDAEAYWSLVLCKYGIEYVEDPASHKRIPTVNRTQFTSIFADEDYKQAIQYADGYQKDVYEAEAKAIDEIQKGILEISNKEEPFDVFICYKETDNQGRRTPDSVLATELYHELTKEGFKVFFSRITLEDKLGTAYEPYIFAALNSSKVMVALGTKAEYFNSVWVKNEWSRYLSLIKNGAKKTLIPVYRDMDPYDLPEEFSHLQAQDMSKLGFMQDLIRGIGKILSVEKPTSTETVVINSGNASVEPLLKRAFMFLEDKDWNSADEYCEKVLDQDPENAMAYLGKLMAELRVTKQEKLADCSKPFSDNNNYKKAVRFADSKLAETLTDYILHIKERNEQERLEKLYNKTVASMNSAITEKEFKLVAKDFKEILEYKDSELLMQQCFDKAEIARKDSIYAYAKAKAEEDSIEAFEEAIKNFEIISDWKDSNEQISICKSKIEDLKVKKEKERLENERKSEIARIEYAKKAKKNKILVIIVSIIIVITIILVVIAKTVVIPANMYNKAIEFENNADYLNAISMFTKLENFKDSKDHLNASTYNQGLIYEKNKDYSNAIDTFKKVNDYKDASEHINTSTYEQAKSFEKNKDYSKAIATFKTISGYKDSIDRIRKLLNRNSFAESAGGTHTVALKSNGTVVAVGNNQYGQCDMSGWKDIVAISAGYNHTVGLKLDGTVVAVGYDAFGQCNVSTWENIIAISSGTNHTVGLKLDGTVVAVGGNDDGQCNVSDWKDIIAISAGGNHTVGLKSDGTVIAVGSNKYGQCDVSDWKDIVAISAGGFHTVGLKSNGTSVAVGYNYNFQCDVSYWENIVAISAGSEHTLGLKSDGTVVVKGAKSDRKCDVSDWKDIVAVSAGGFHSVGLKSDGTVVAVGDYDKGQCKVSSWKNIKTPKK